MNISESDNIHSNLYTIGQQLPAIIFRRDDLAGSSSSSAAADARKPCRQKSPTAKKKRHSSLSGILKPKPPRAKKTTTRKLKTSKTGDDDDDGAAVFCRPCTECGKKFFSKKALYGHMRCHPERHWRGINPPTAAAAAVVADEYEIAACLLLLAGGGRAEDDVVVFECSSCKRVFGSHQALGGHRASHKNVKGCFAMATRCTNHRLLGFDLNLPAVDHGDNDDDDEEQCCYSSSLSMSTCDYLDLRLRL